MQQPSLLGGPSVIVDLEPVPNPFPNVRRTDPETSRMAAAPDRTRDRDRALAILKAAGADGLTDFELADRLGRQQTSAGKRRGELRDQGLVEATGRTRKAPSGSLATVWRATTIGQR